MPLNSSMGHASNLITMDNAFLAILRQIAKGKTTKTEVRAKFGEPALTTAKERGAEEWSYKISGSGNA